MDAQLAQAEAEAYWDELRESVLRRDRCCRLCGATEQLSVQADPRIPGHFRRAAPSDWVALCSDCCKAIEAATERRAKAGLN
jgi:hypothetical protein